jgi:hypothetical protein
METTNHAYWPTRRKAGSRCDLVGWKVARLSVGEMEEKLTQPSGKVCRGHAGAKVTLDQRREIAKKTASARWE